MKEKSENDIRSQKRTSGLGEAPAGKFEHSTADPDHQEYEFFIVKYQPKQNLVTQQVAGFEALLRWRHPNKGLVGPSRFIEFAEQNEMIGALTIFIFWKVCQHQKILQSENLWQNKGSNSTRTSVNFSPLQFTYDNLELQLDKIIDELDVDPRSIEIEITEGTKIGNNIDKINNIMRRLISKGFTFSIDDFGVGYASLSLLLQLPFSKIKIDKIFTQNIGLDSSKDRLLQSIVDLAKGQGLKVLAEAVETKQQLEFLKEIGCDEIQGYLYSKDLFDYQVRDMLREKN